VLVVVVVELVHTPHNAGHSDMASICTFVFVLLQGPPSMNNGLKQTSASLMPLQYPVVLVVRLVVVEVVDVFVVTVVAVTVVTVAEVVVVVAVIVVVTVVDVVSTQVSQRIGQASCFPAMDCRNPNLHPYIGRLDLQPHYTWAAEVPELELV
jgi:hypothetical protein